MNKFAEYTAGRNDGLLLARNIFKEGGMDALEKELKLRGATNLHTSLMQRELDKLTESVKHICFDTIMIATISVLHDEFGFGEKRLQRVVNKFNKLTDYLDNGWIYWMDMIEEIKTKTGIEITDKYINEINMGKHWAHPEYEDIYTECDWVAPDKWKAVLKKIGYSERKKEGDSCMEILDEKKTPVFEYHGKFEQIGMYDILTGIAYAKETREKQYA